MPGKTKPIVFTPQSDIDLWKWVSLVRDQYELNYTKWQTRARILGSAYSLAVNNVDMTLRKRDEDIAINRDIYFGVISALTVGWLGGIGEGFANKKLWAKLEDGIQAAVGNALSFDKDKLIEKSSAKVDKTPLQYQNSLLNALADQWEKVLESFIDIKKQLYNTDPAKIAKEDLGAIKDKTEKELKKIPLCNPPQKPDMGNMAKDFETWMWAKWIKDVPLVELKKDYLSKMYISWVNDDPGSAVEQRMTILGIPEAAGIGKNFNWITIDPDVIKLDNWATRFLYDHKRTAYEPKGEKITFEI